jgi:hypothetical protein
MTRRSFSLMLAAPGNEWRSAFDGKSFAGWRDPSKLAPAGDSWEIADGCFRTNPNPGLLEDLESVDEYLDFEFSFDWKIEKGGNSGVKYSIAERIFFENEKAGWAQGKRVPGRSFKAGTRGQQYLSACEFQLIEDNEPWKPVQKTGALYGLAAPETPANAATGEWHSGLLKKQGMRVEHWINGKRVLAIQLDSPEIEANLKSNPRRLEAYKKSLTRRSTIALQNHGGSIAWFRNLKIR